MAAWTTPSAIHSKCGETRSLLAVLAIDDDTATYWFHDADEYHWIIFDMGATKKITKIRLCQYADYYWYWGRGSGLTVYVGDDPANLGDAVWEGALAAAGWQESGVFEKNGRYVKLVSKLHGSNQVMMEFDAMAEALVAAHTLKIEAVPPISAPIKVNDQLIGYTPKTVTVEEGEHTISVPEEVET